MYKTRYVLFRARVGSTRGENAIEERKGTDESQRCVEESMELGGRLVSSWIDVLPACWK